MCAATCTIVNLVKLEVAAGVSKNSTERDGHESKLSHCDITLKYAQRKREDPGTSSRLDL